MPLAGVWRVGAAAAATYALIQLAILNNVHLFRLAAHSELKTQRNTQTPDLLFGLHETPNTDEEYHPHGPTGLDGDLLVQDESDLRYDQEADLQPSQQQQQQYRQGAQHDAANVEHEEDMGNIPTDFLW